MGSDDFDDALESAMKAYQTFYHLNATGILDAPTATLMSMPRCGVPDDLPSSNTINPNYVFSTAIKWPRDQMHIHYIVSPGSQPEQPITSAFDAWAGVSNFTFERVRDEKHAKLRVIFTRIDGPGGYVGYANPILDFPSIRFDEEEPWSVGAVAGSLDLETAATHEIGHILGLAHSQVKEAVMYATIGSGVVKTLTQDDIDGIRAKYST